MKTVDFAGSKVVPSKVVCIGRNYTAHIEELGNKVPEEMVLFFKPNAAISDKLFATRGESLHYEGELCFGLEAGAFRYVGFGWDLTKRGLQGKLKKAGLPWERSKSFRGSAVFSNFVPFDGNVEGLEMEVLIDGVRVQLGLVANMINKPSSILSEILSFSDLEDHDIIMTGTPEGVGAIKQGALYEGLIRCAGEVLVRGSWIAQA